MVTTLKTSVKSAGSKLRKLFYTASLAVISGNMTVYANTNTGLSEEVTETADSLVQKFVDIIFYIFRTVGILLLAWAIAQLVIAFKNEDADSKQRATILLVISILLIVLKSIFDGLNLFEM